jgi:hypothetical protein
VGYQRDQRAVARVALLRTALEEVDTRRIAHRTALMTSPILKRAPTAHPRADEQLQILLVAGQFLILLVAALNQIRQRTVAGVGSTTIAVNTQSDVMPARVNSSKYGISSLLLA